MAGKLPGAYLRRTLSGLRRAVFEARQFGLMAYLRYGWRRLTIGPMPEPEANAPFRIGADAEIVVHESSIAGIDSHFVDKGRGTGEFDAFRRLAPGHSTFLDIGAASGIFAVAFCSLTGACAFGFEPSPVLFANMTDLFGVNPDLDITPINLALGALVGVKPVISSSNAQFRAVDTAGGDAMSVGTLDEFVRARRIAPDFAKVDVEGMELEVLRGGIKTFGAAGLDALLLEVHPNMVNDSRTVSEIETLLHELGFELFTLLFAPIDDLAKHIAEGPPARRRATNIVCLKDGQGSLTARYPPVSTR